MNPPIPAPSQPRQRVFAAVWQHRSQSPAQRILSRLEAARQFAKLKTFLASP